MRYPAGMPPWRLFPPSRAPGVSVAIPTLVPGNPPIVTAGRRPPRFDYSTGWRDANHNIGRRGAEGQRACKANPINRLKSITHPSFLVPNCEPIRQQSAYITKLFSVGGRDREPAKRLSR